MTTTTTKKTPAAEAFAPKPVTAVPSSRNAVPAPAGDDLRCLVGGAILAVADGGFFATRETYPVLEVAGVTAAFFLGFFLMRAVRQVLRGRRDTPRR